MALSPLISNGDDGPIPPALSMPSQMPTLPQGLQPLITTPRMQREALLEGQINQHENPQKPQGFWQNVRHIAATIGNDAGNILAPGTMALIPGTQLHGDIQNSQRSSELAGLQKQDQEDAADASQNASRNAQTGEAQARTGLLGVQTDQAKQNLNAPPPEPSLAVAYAHAVQEAIKNGVDPSTDPIVNHLRDAITGLAKQPTAKSLEHVNLSGPDGKPMAATYDPSDGSYKDASGNKIANPIPYEKPPQVNVNAGDASLDRLAGRLGKPYQAGFDAANKQLDTIDKTMRSIDSGYKGQALALPETMTALVSGQGTGVRITQAELNAIGQHNGIKGDIESFFNRISGEGSMTDQDKKQLKGILAETRQRVLDKQQIHKDALDGINGAPDRGAVAKSDADARQRISDLERTGHFAGQTVKLKNGQTITIQKVHPDGSYD